MVDTNEMDRSRMMRCLDTTHQITPISGLAENLTNVLNNHSWSSAIETPVKRLSLSLIENDTPDFNTKLDAIAPIQRSSLKKPFADISNLPRNNEVVKSAKNSKSLTKHLSIKSKGEDIVGSDDEFLETLVLDDSDGELMHKTSAHASLFSAPIVFRQRERDRSGSLFPDSSFDIPSLLDEERIVSDLFDDFSDEDDLGKKRKITSENSICAKRRRLISSSSSDESEFCPKFPSSLNSVLNVMASPSENLIGDMTLPHSLPLVSGRCPDICSISCETLADLISSKNFSFTIIDCRYPYEYAGGHIRDAINIWSKPALLNTFFQKKYISKLSQSKRRLIIFHCEFSSKRAPNLYRYLRSEDRKINERCYPNLYYPEIYLLEGGYSRFYDCCDRKFCSQPAGYIPMDHANYVDQYNKFRTKSKSFNTAHERSRLAVRSLTSRF